MKKLFSGSIILILLTLTACSKEKAEAIQLGAEVFLYDAIEAIDQVNLLFRQNLELVQLSDVEMVNKIVSDINELDAVDDEVMKFWVSEMNMNDEAIKSTNEKFEEIKKQYYAFEAMFKSLDRGSYFAKDAVAKAEKHAINLTVQLINFSKIIQENYFIRRADRLLIIERLNKAKEEQNEQLRNELLKNIAMDFIKLNASEKSQKEKTVRACLSGAESGYAVAKLIRDYDKISVTDIINSIKLTLNYTAEITNSKEQIGDMIMRFEEVESTILGDPYWKDLLNKQLN